MSKQTATSAKAAGKTKTAKAIVAKGPEATISEEQRQGERRAADAKKASDNAMAFSVQQMTTPVAGGNKAPVLETPPAATNAFQKELAELQAKHGIAPSAVKVKAPRPDKIVQHGVTRPAATTLCGKIWAAADELSASSHGVATIAALKLHADVAGINDHTIKTQYARWRAFNGIVGRLPKINAVAEPVAPAYNAEESKPAE